MTNDNGTILSEIGEIITFNEYSDYGLSNSESRVSYNGEQTDSSDYIYLRARYYDPEVGAFLQIDNNYDGEVESTISQNRYTYALNNPYKYIDKNGNEAISIGIGIGIAFPPLIPILAAIAVAIAAIAVVSKAGQYIAEHYPGGGFAFARDVIDIISNPWDIMTDALLGLTIMGIAVCASPKEVSIEEEKEEEIVKVPPVTPDNDEDDGKKGTGSNNFDLNDPSSFEGENINDVEKYLDDVLDGWEKKPLRDGNGVRYLDGKGNSYQLNNGYSNFTDPTHGGPYIKISQNGQITRFSLIK